MPNVIPIVMPLGKGKKTKQKNTNNVSFAFTHTYTLVKTNNLAFFFKKTKKLILPFPAYAYIHKTNIVIGLLFVLFFMHLSLM